MKKHLKTAASIFLGLLIAGWTIWQVQGAQLVSKSVRYRYVDRQTVLDAFAGDLIPPTVPALMQTAGVLANDVFPPQHTVALELYRKALLRDPLNSIIWFKASQEMALLGRMDEARAALRRSDELDPFFPKQRLESIQLWAILGDAKRSLDVARSLTKLGGGYRISAARGLASINFSPSEVFDALDIGTVSPDEQISVVSAVKVSDAVKMREVLEKISWDQIENLETVNQGLRVVSFNPPIPDLILRFWRLASENLRESSGWTVDNPMLAVSPFQKDLLLGWQAFPADQSGLEYRWLSPSSRDEFQQGMIIVTFTSGHAANPNLNWLLHRFLLHEDARASVTLKVRQRPASRLSAQVQLRLNGKPGGMSEVLTPGYEWSRISVPCVSPGTAAIVEIRLIASPISPETIESGTVELQIGGLEVNLPDSGEAASNE